MYFSITKCSKCFNSISFKTCVHYFYLLNLLSRFLWWCFITDERGDNYQQRIYYFTYNFSAAEIDEGATELMNRMYVDTSYVTLQHLSRKDDMRMSNADDAAATDRKHLSFSVCLYNASWNAADFVAMIINLLRWSGLLDLLPVV